MHSCHICSRKCMCTDGVNGRCPVRVEAAACVTAGTVAVTQNLSGKRIPGSSVSELSCFLRLSLPIKELTLRLTQYTTGSKHGWAAVRKKMVARALTIFHHKEQGGGSCCPNPSPPLRDPAQDLHCITSNFHYLQISGWYWGNISASEAREALIEKPEGTFLMRDSSHPQYMLALSVQTRCGPTSVRIEYSKGSFWLDSISPSLPQLQSFPDVVSLIQHYTGSGHTPQSDSSKDIYSETKPEPDKHTAKDSGVPLKLKHPLHRPEPFPSLQHLTRLTIHRHTTDCTDLLPLPKPLLHYLQDYPFHI